MSVVYFNCDHTSEENDYLQMKLTEVPKCLGVNGKWKYERIRVVGLGTHSTVYEYREMTTNQTVAVKVKRKTLEQRDMGDVGQALQADLEISIHKHLKHKNIVQYLESSEGKYLIYLFLEFCEMGTLEDMLRNRVRLTPIEARYILHQLATGVKYLHENRVAHRDLKPRNILLNGEMTVKIADFGWVTIFKEENEYSQTVCGTPRFGAPEILNRTGHGFEVDSWSIGCILYNMLVGMEPFMDEDGGNRSTLRRIKRAKYQPIPEELCLPQSAKDLIKNLLSRNPSKRLTMQGILEHPFLNEGDPIPKYLPSGLFYKLPAPSVRQVTVTPEICEQIVIHHITEEMEKRVNSETGETDCLVGNVETEPECSEIDFSSVFEHPRRSKNGFHDVLSFLCLKCCT